MSYHDMSNIVLISTRNVNCVIMHARY